MNVADSTMKKSPDNYEEVKQWLNRLMINHGCLHLLKNEFTDMLELTIPHILNITCYITYHS